MVKYRTRSCDGKTAILVNFRVRIPYKHDTYQNSSLKSLEEHCFGYTPTHTAAHGINLRIAALRILPCGMFLKLQYVQVNVRNGLIRKNKNNNRIGTIRRRQKDGGRIKWAGTKAILHVVLAKVLRRESAQSYGKRFSICDQPMAACTQLHRRLSSHSLTQGGRVWHVKNGFLDVFFNMGSVLSVIRIKAHQRHYMELKSVLN